MRIKLPQIVSLKDTRVNRSFRVKWDLVMIPENHFVTTSWKGKSGPKMYYNKQIYLEYNHNNITLPPFSWLCFSYKFEHYYAVRTFFGIPCTLLIKWRAVFTLNFTQYRWFRDRENILVAWKLNPRTKTAHYKMLYWFLEEICCKNKYFLHNKTQITHFFNTKILNVL